ncbi:MAG: hypothetical protein ACXWBU_17320, partial [Usitatibacter sp.]
MVRTFTRTGDPGVAREQAGVEAMRKMGAQVEVKTFGAITCVATIPSQSMALAGDGTSCTVKKAPKFAVIEVAAKDRKDMVSMERLRTVAEGIAGGSRQPAITLSPALSQGRGRRWQQSS